MITFDRKSGILMVNGLVVKGVWSGHGDAANDPSREAEHGVGPLPGTTYHIGPMIDGGHLGPDVMALTPVRPGTTFGRSGFYIHGDKPGDTDHSASDGCIIAPHAARIAINQSSDRTLVVT